MIITIEKVENGYLVETVYPVNHESYVGAEQQKQRAVFTTKEELMKALNRAL